MKYQNMLYVLYTLNSQHTSGCGHSDRGLGSALIAPHSGEGDLGYAGRAAALPLGQLL